MKKVYLVSSGSYSDYSIDSVFSTKEMAQRYIDAHGEYGEFNDIEEYDLDSPIPQKRDRYAFRVDIFGSGNIESVYPSPAFEHRVKEKPCYIENYYGREPKMMLFVMARDKEHAIKIAHDKAMEIKATVGWGNLID